MRDLLREPLLHFLLLGLGLFLVFEFAADDDAADDSSVITVSEETLLTYLQYQSRSFEPGLALARLRKMPAEDLERLIGDYVREEALYREALALGLDNNDYIIKRRLVQSIEFLTTGFATAEVDVSDNDVRQYYEANSDSYRQSPTVTFTHVFLSSETRDREEALALAEAKLSELNEQAVPFEGATQHGDYFPYATNYVEREPSYIAGQLGRPMTEALFRLESGVGTWQGPLESPLGFHLVLLTERTASRIPPLEEIADAVRYDAEQAAVKALRDEAVERIMDTYTVRTELDFGGEAGSE